MNDAIYRQLEIDNVVNDDEEISVKEGKIIYRLHKLRERNKTLIKKKKSIAQAANKLQCEICQFDFKEAYGELGDGFIACHHTKPISQMESNDLTRLDDLALVCANCHRMLHRDLNITLLMLKIKMHSLKNGI